MRTARRKFYSVDWYRGDFCYRTTTGCTWEQVQNCKKTARLLGEKNQIRGNRCQRIPVLIWNTQKKEVY